MAKTVPPVVWVYQLSRGDWDWDHNWYRLEVAESKRVFWLVGKKQAGRAGRRDP